VNESDRFIVTPAQQTKRGDVTLALVNEYAILLFPASCNGEAWRLFASGSGRHLVFPTPQRDFAISRRERPVDDTEWEAWLKVVEAPKTGDAMQAPPVVVLTVGGTRYRCARCGTVLVIAEFGGFRHPLHLMRPLQRSAALIGEFAYANARPRDAGNAQSVLRSLWRGGRGGRRLRSLRRL
jgi:hypothetical protein